MLSWKDVQAAVKPLRLIFWGGILWIFDLSFTTLNNGTGFRCDILDDTVGTLLITIGVFRLAKAAVPGRFRAVMRFVKVIAIASIAETALKHFVFAHPAPLDFILTAVGLCQLAATILFCLAMKWFCDEAGLPGIARSWKITFLLFCFIYALPLGLFYIAVLNTIMGGSAVNFDLGAGGLLLLPVSAVPLVYLFISTSRMHKGAQLGMVEWSAAGGFPRHPGTRGTIASAVIIVAGVRSDAGDDVLSL